MLDPAPERLLTLEERHGADDRLAAHFVQGHLTATELEHRLDLVYAADTRDQLTALELDLPGLDPAAHPASPSDQAPPSEGSSSSGSRPSRHNLIVSICGGTERRGNWTPACRTTALTLMGGTVLDFRNAVMESSEMVVWLAVALGGVEIIVPPGVRAQWSGIALMGGVEQMSGSPAGPDTPVLHIRGLVFMGGVEIIERLPRETHKQARRRHRKERKARHG